MSLVVLLFLAIVWAVFLVPQVLRARAEKTPSDSIGAFRNQLNVLDRMAPGAPVRAPRSLAHGAVAAPMHRPVGVRRVSHKELVRRRRTNILVGLLASMALTLVLGVLLGGMLLLAHLVLDLLFVTYCGMLVRARNLATEREMKVRYLPGPMVAPEGALLLRRSGS